MSKPLNNNSLRSRAFPKNYYPTSKKLKKPRKEDLKPAVKNAKTAYKKYEKAKNQDFRETYQNSLFAKIYEGEMDVLKNLFNLDDLKLFENVHLGAKLPKIYAEEVENEKLGEYIGELIDFRSEDSPELSETLKSNLEGLSDTYQNLYKINREPHGFQKSPEEEVAKALKNLQVGERYTFPAKASQGTLYEFERLENNTFNIIVISGERKSFYFNQSEGKKKLKVEPVVYYHQVPEEAILFSKKDNFYTPFIEKIIETRSPQVEAFSHISSFRRTTPAILNHFSTAQRSESKKLKALNTWILLQFLREFPDDKEKSKFYCKAFKFKSRLVSLVAFTQNIENIKAGPKKQKGIYCVKEGAKALLNDFVKLSQKMNFDDPVLTDLLETGLNTGLIASNWADNWLEEEKTHEKDFPKDFLNSDEFRKKRLSQHIGELNGKKPINRLNNYKLSEESPRSELKAPTDIYELRSLLEEIKKGSLELVDLLPIPSDEALLWNNLTTDQALEVTKQIHLLMEQFPLRTKGHLPEYQDRFFTLIAIADKLFRKCDSDRYSGLNCLDNFRLDSTYIFGIWEIPQNSPREELHITRRADLRAYFLNLENKSKFIDENGKCTKVYETVLDRNPDLNQHNPIINPQFKDQAGKSIFQNDNETVHAAFVRFLENECDAGITYEGRWKEDKTVEKERDLIDPFTGKKVIDPNTNKTIKEKYKDVIPYYHDPFSYQKSSFLQNEAHKGGYLNSYKKLAYRLNYLLDPKGISDFSSFSVEFKRDNVFSKPLSRKYQQGSIKNLENSFYGKMYPALRGNREQFSKSRSLEKNEKDLLSENDRKSSEKLKKGEKASQKEAIAKLLNLDEVQPSLQPALVIKTFKENLNLLQSEEWRDFLMVYFFKTIQNQEKGEYSPALEELKTGEALFEIVQDFVLKGIEKYFLTQRGMKPNLDIVLFLFRFSYFIEKNDPGKRVLYPTFLEKSGFSSPLALLKNWTTSAEFTSVEKEEIYFHIISHLLGKSPENLIDEEWGELFGAWAHLKNSEAFEREKFEDLGFINSIKETYESYLKKFLDLYEDFDPGVIADTFLNSYVPGAVHSKKWVFRQDTCTFAEIDGNHKWKFNPFTGQAAGNNGIIKKIASLPENDGLSRLFQNRKHELSELGDKVIFYDKIWGDIEFSDTRWGEKDIFRLVDGKRFKYISPNDLKSDVPGNLAYDTVAWITEDHINFCDKKTGEILFEGSFELDGVGNRGRFQLKSIKEPSKTVYLGNFGEVFNPKFEKSDHIFVLENERGEGEVQFPRIHTRTGKPLTFFGSKDRLVYGQDPNYLVQTENFINPLGNFEQMLVLKHKEKAKNYKLLIPYYEFDASMKYNSDISVEVNLKVPFVSSDLKWDSSLSYAGSHRFFEVDIQNGKIATDTVEGKLFLIKILMCQKNFNEALTLLNEIKEYDIKSKQSIGFLKDLLKFQDDFNVVNPEAYAISLKIFLKMGFLTQNKRDETKEKTYSYYKNYIEHLKKIPSFFQLSFEEEERLRSLIKPGFSDFSFENRGKELNAKLERSQTYFKKTHTYSYQTVVGESWDYFKGNESVPEMPHRVFMLSYWDDNKIYDPPKGMKKIDSNYFKMLSVPNYSREYDFSRFWTDYNHLKSPFSTKEEKDAFFFALSHYEYSEFFSILKFAATAPDSAPRSPNLPEGRSFMTDEEFTNWMLNNLQPAWKKALGGNAEPTVTAKKIFDKKSEGYFKTINDSLKISFKPEETLVPGVPRDDSLSDLHGLHGINPEGQVEIFRDVLRKNALSKSKETNWEKKKKNLLKFDAREFSENERNFRELIRSEGEKYLREIKKGSLLNAEKEKIKEPKTIEEAEEYLKEVKKIQASYFKINNSLEKIIEKKLNAISLGDQKVGQAKQELGLIKKVTLIEAIRAFSAYPEENVDPLFKSLNPYLSEEHIEDIKKDLETFLNVGANIGFIAPVVDSFEKIVALFQKGELAEEDLKQEIEPVWDEAMGFLMTERQFDPSKNKQALVFEYLSGLRVREEQAVIIQEVLNELFGPDEAKNRFGVVFQLIMGGGKTSVILSKLVQLISKEGKIALFCCDPSQYSGVIGNLTKFQGTRYGQEVIPFEYTRSDLQDLQVLRDIQSKLDDAKTGKKAIVLKTSLLQSFQLELKSLCQELTRQDEVLLLDLQSKVLIAEKARILAEILTTIKEDGIGLLDEVDINLNVMKGVHFPIGEKETLPHSRIALVKEIYKQMSVHPDLKGLVNLGKNKQNKLSENDYKNIVRPKLAELLISEFFEKRTGQAYSKEFIESFKVFVSGKMVPEVEEIAHNPDFIDPEAARAELQKAFARSLPKILDNEFKEEDFDTRELKRGYLSFIQNGAHPDFLNLIENEESLKKLQSNDALLQEVYQNAAAEIDYAKNEEEFLKICKEQMKLIEHFFLKEKGKPENLATRFVEDSLNYAEFIRELHLIFNSLTEDDKETAHLFALSRYLLETIVPANLAKKANEHYGREKILSEDVDISAEDFESEGIRVVPYSGVGKPALTEYANVYEKLAFHMQQASHKKWGVSLSQVKQLAEKYTSKAERELEQNPGKTFDTTQEAQVFLELTGVSLAEYDKEGQLEKAKEGINKSLEDRLNFEEESAKYNVDYTPKILSSTSISVTKLLSQVIACSGTIWNKDTYAYDLRYDIPREGTEGRILDKFLSDVENKQSFLAVCKKENFKSFMNAVEASRGPEGMQEVRGLIDVGGLLNDFTNYEVAQDVLSYFREKNPDDPKFQGVVFTYVDPATMEEEYSILKLSGERITLKNSTADEVERHGISRDKLFFFYDQQRATGTDFKQMPNSINLVTFDPKSTSMRSFLQATLRLRQYFLGQKADLVIPKDTLKAFPGFKGEDKKVTSEMVINAAVRNQAVEIGKQLFKSFRDQVNEEFAFPLEEILRDAVIQEFTFNLNYEAIEESLSDNTLAEEDKKSYQQSLAKIKDLSDAFKMFMITLYKDNPFEQFSGLDFFEDPKKVLGSYIKIQKEDFKKALEAAKPILDSFEEEGEVFDSEALITRVDYKLDLILEEISQLKFKVKRKAGIGGEGANIEINNEELSEILVEKEIDLQEDRKAELEGYQLLASGNKIDETEWKFPNKPCAFDALLAYQKDREGCEIVSFHDYFKEGFQGDLGEHIKYSYAYENVFPSYLSMSQNFRYSTDKDLPLFHPSQKEATQALVYKTSMGEVKFVLVSKKEGALFKEKIKSGELQESWLVNLDGNEFEKGNLPRDEDFSKMFEKGLFWLNIFDGNAEYVSRNGSFILDELSEDNKYRKDALRLFSMRAYQKGEDYFKIFSLDERFDPKDKPLSFPPIEHAQRFVSEKRIREIPTLSQEVLASLNQMELFFITPKQFEQLPQNKKNITPPNVIGKIAPEEVSNLKDYQLKFLQTKEQVEAVLDTGDNELVSHLGRDPRFAKQQVEWIPANKLKYLPGEAVRFIEGKERIGKIAGEQLKYIVKDQVKHINPEYVNELGDKMLNYLEEMSQIQRLLPERIVKLKKSTLIGMVNPILAGHLTSWQWLTLAGGDLKSYGKEEKENYKQLYGKLLPYAQFMGIAPTRNEFIKTMHPTHFWVLTTSEEANELSNIQVGKMLESDGAVVKLLYGDKVPYLPGKHIQNIPASRLQFVIPDQVRALTKEDKKCVQALLPVELPDNEHFNDLMSALPKECWKHILKEQVREITSIKTVRDKLNVKSASYLPVKLIHQLNPNKGDWDKKMIQNLNSKQILSLSDLDIKLFAQLTNSQCKKINFNNIHFDTWNKKDFKILGTQKAFLSHLPSKYVNYLSINSVKNLQGHQIQHITKEKLILAIPKEKYQALTPHQIHLLIAKKPDLLDSLIQKKLFSESQWIRMDEQHLKGIKLTKKQLKNFPDAHVRLLSEKQIQNKYGSMTESRLLGLAMCFAFIFRILGEGLFNLFRLAFTAIRAVAIQTDENKKALKVQIQRTFVYAPMEALLAFVQVANPAKHKKVLNKYYNNSIRRASL